jgi:hypothetical protein
LAGEAADALPADGTLSTARGMTTHRRASRLIWMAIQRKELILMTGFLK